MNKQERRGILDRCLSNKLLTIITAYFFSTIVVKLHKTYRVRLGSCGGEEITSAQFSIHEIT